jgi:hypothetical protein
MRLSTGSPKPTSRPRPHPHLTSVFRCGTVFSTMFCCCRSVRRTGYYPPRGGRCSGRAHG